MLTRGRVDTNDPQSPIFALLVLAADVRVLQRGVDRLFGLAIELALRLIEPFGSVEQLLPFGSPDRSSFNSWHFCCPAAIHAVYRPRQTLFTSERTLFIRQHPVQLRRVVGRDLLRPAHVALGLGGLAGQDVTLERAGPDDLAGARLLEALGGAPMCFQFWHLCLSTSL